jgi:hypothetical protein
VNENGGFAEPALVSDLARSVVVPDPDLVLRARRLVALREAASKEIEERWAHELAASICARVFAAEDCGAESGAESGAIEDVIAETIEQRWRNVGTYWGWKLVGFPRAVRICIACVNAWKGTES